MADGTDPEAKNIEEMVANKILEEIQEEIKRSGKIDPGLASDIIRYDPEAGGLVIKTGLPEDVSREMNKILKKMLGPNGTGVEF